MPPVPSPALPADFDPDGPGGEGLFGLPFTPQQARIHVIAVPWEATTSYGRGTAAGPAAITAASVQVDLHDLEYGDFWRAGIALLPMDPDISAWSAAAEPDALAVIAADGELPEAAARVDALSQKLNQRIHHISTQILAAGSIPALLGGDHSCPYGQIKAVAQAHPGLGILHIDAHADLRDGYLGFRWSHASIFHHVLELPGVKRLVGVGYRDLGAAEIARIQAEPDRIRTFTDVEIARGLACGEPWARWCEHIVDALPDPVYISLDIDGLDPSLCPHTGTPVPGGLSFHQLQFLLWTLSQRRQIVGFDLCEVCPSPDPSDEWDANIGARVLYKLAGATIRSRHPST